MLSSVLSSERAIQVNMEIMGTLVRLREMLATSKELTGKLSELERRTGEHDKEIQTIFEAIRQLMSPPKTPRKKIGFEVKERAAAYGRKKGSGT